MRILQNKSFRRLSGWGIITFCMSGGALKARAEQDSTRYIFGAGIQFLGPAFCLSTKIALTRHSVIQGMASPFSFAAFAAASSAGHSSSSFYGLRYIYRFSSGSMSHPYVFGGVGLMEWTAGSDFTGNWTDAGSTTVRYILGGGYEYIFSISSLAFGISGELGLGNMRTESTTGKNKHAPLVGIGVHYYRMGTKKRGL